MDTNGSEELTSVFADNPHTSNNMAASLLNNLPVAVYVCDTQGLISSYNKAAEDLWGHKPVASHNLWCPCSVFTLKGNAMALDDTPMARSVQQRIAINGETIMLKQHGTGRQIMVKCYALPQESEGSEVSGVVVTLIDVTPHISNQSDQSILAAIVDTSEDIIISKTLGGVITSWNKAAERMFGYSQDEVIGKHISVLIPPTRLNEEEYIIGQIAQGNRVDHFETIRVTKAGKEIPLSISVSPVKDMSGRIIGASKIARDISSQKQAEETLRQYTERLEIINYMIEAVSEELDLNKILQKVTDATTELTGAQFGAFFYNTVNAGGESFLLYTLSGAPKEAFERFGMPRNTAVFHSTFSGLGVVRVDDITKDARYGLNAPHYGMPAGHLPVVSYMAVPVISRSGATIGGLFFGHPKPGVFTKEHENIVISIAAQAAIGIDNAKLYEEVKALNQKKDEFIGLASHELKTPLTSISGYLQILDRLKTDEQASKFISKTKQQVKRLTSLVSDLLDVSKIEAGKLQLVKDVFDIRALLDDAIELIQYSHTAHTIKLNTSHSSLGVYGDANRIEQVVINLLTNAIKYSHLSAQVEISLSCNENEVLIGVKDFGIGIAADKIPHLFSRFYRVEDLNPHISGLGIGLYISHEIITRHKGKLWVDSEPDKGSTFWFTLPVQAIPEGE